MQITLQQFEQIDGLLRAVQNRPTLIDIMERGRDECVRLYFTPEWELFDALVDAMGLDYVQSFHSAEEAAADVVTQALCSASFVTDEVEA